MSYRNDQCQNESLQFTEMKSVSQKHDIFFKQNLNKTIQTTDTEAFHFFIVCNNLKLL